MNETLKTIAERYSCRDFDGAPLTDGQIEAIVDAALAAPSAMNRQPWHVTMVTDKVLIDELDAEGMNVLAAADDKSIYERMKERGGKMFYNAPCMAMVTADGSSYSMLDCGILSQNIALAAHALGLGSVICGMAGIPLGGGKGAELKKRLQFPEGYNFAVAVLVGAVKSGKEPHEHEPEKVSYIK